MGAHTNHTELSSQITRLLVHTGWSAPGNFQARQPDHKEPFISAFVLSTEHTFLRFRIVVHLQKHFAIENYWTENQGADLIVLEGGDRASACVSAATSFS